MTSNNTTRPGLRQWLFNPFHYVAGGRALVVGLVAILLAGFVGSLSNTHFDGVLDTHSGRPAPLFLFLSEGVIDWLCLALALLGFGALASKSSVRPVDVLGTQALARWPTIFTALVTLLPGSSRYSAHLAHTFAGIGDPVVVQSSDPLVFGIAIIVMLLVLVWMVYLMYRAFSVSCNLQGGKAVGLFIAGLVLAEIVSKVALFALLMRM